LAGDYLRDETRDREPNGRDPKNAKQANVIALADLLGYEFAPKRRDGGEDEE
jgi:hypothetical protein